MWFWGLGTQQNFEEAYQIIRPCLERKYARAYLLMGEVYEHGLGIEKDFEKARSYYQEALELGYGA